MNTRLINNVEFNEDAPVVKTFNDWAEVNNWWTSNPTAVRIEPEIEAVTIDEYNKLNHELTFPCTMKFLLPCA